MPPDLPAVLVNLHHRHAARRQAKPSGPLDRTIRKALTRFKTPLLTRRVLHLHHKAILVELAGERRSVQKSPKVLVGPYAFHRTLTTNGTPAQPMSHRVQIAASAQTLRAPSMRVEPRSRGYSARHELQGQCPGSPIKALRVHQIPGELLAPIVLTVVPQLLSFAGQTTKLLDKHVILPAFPSLADNLSRRGQVKQNDFPRGGDPDRAATAMHRPPQLPEGHSDCPKRAISHFPVVVQRGLNHIRRCDNLLRRKSIQRTNRRRKQPNFPGPTPHSLLNVHKIRSPPRLIHRLNQTARST